MIEMCGVFVVGCSPPMRLDRFLWASGCGALVSARRHRRQSYWMRQRGGEITGIGEGSLRQASERSRMACAAPPAYHRELRHGLAIEVFGSDQRDQALQLLAVALSTIEAQEHPCRCRVGPLRIRAARDHLQHPLSWNKPRLWSQAVASDRLQEEHRLSMTEEDRMHIAGHTQRIALGLALYSGAVDAEQRQAGHCYPLGDLDCDPRHVKKTLRVWFILLRPIAHHGAETG